MPVKFVDNTNRVRAQMRVELSAGLKRLLEGIHKAAYPNTPKDTGDLRNRVLRQTLGLTARISWLENYARPQEETQHANYTTSGTGPHYAENAVRQEVAKPQKYFGGRA